MSKYMKAKSKTNFTPYYIYKCARLRVKNKECNCNAKKKFTQNEKKC